MFLDASVIVAILGREPGYEEILNRLAIEAGPFQLSPLVRFEATVSLARKKAGAIGSASSWCGARQLTKHGHVAREVTAIGVRGHGANRGRGGSGRCCG